MEESSIYSFIRYPFLALFSGGTCYAGLESKDSTKSKIMDSSKMTLDNTINPRECGRHDLHIHSIQKYLKCSV